MDSPTKIKTSEATGISRSGRVRKKSSKLTDFESPDEIDTRFKRRTDRPQKVVVPKALSEDSDSFLDEEIDVKDEPLEVEEWGEEPEEEEGEEEDEEVGGEEGGGEGGLSEFSDQLQVDEDSTDVSRETSNYTQAQSLYFSEKQGKKSIMMKGGQVVRRKKAQRKDKGKSRFTAYMLWAREVRPGIIQANPNMDFSAVNKRLGELWALVPTTQKYNWKRRAKRLAAKGNQKGGLISTGRPSRPAPPARANLINKGGVKPAPRPDANPPPALPVPATQGTPHRHPGQKVIKSQGNRCQLQETPGTAAAAKRLDVCTSPHTAQFSFRNSTAALRKKHGNVNQRLPKESPIITAKKRLGECQQPYPAEGFSPPPVPNMEREYFKLEEELDFYILKGWQNEAFIKEKNTNETEDAMESRRGTSQAEGKLKPGKLQSEKELEYASSLETEYEYVDSPSNDSLTNMRMITAVIDDNITNISHQISRAHKQHVKTTILTPANCCSTSSHQTSSSNEQLDPPSILAQVTCFTLDDIFHDLFVDSFKCPYCPLSLAKAVGSVVHKQLTREEASTLYCVCPSRLLVCMSYFSVLMTMYETSFRYYYFLEEMRKYSVSDRVVEWLLRMRRMGRFPVIADVNQVANYLGNNIQYLTGFMKYFIKVYGEQKISLEDWVFPSQRVVSEWHTRLRDHLYVRCGMKPEELLTSKNDLQVFTSAEVLVSLGDFPNEIIISRGKSNLYCLTQRNTGVYRAILTFSAAGQFHPPTILQKGYDLPQWALNEESVDLMASPDGKLDPLVFLGWLRRFEQRLTEAGVPRPVVLFVHGHAAHGSPAVDSFCCSKGIILHSHYHSPINLMDPFIYLLSPLLYHLGCTQEQLTALTDTHPLPDYLLPSVLADAWTQVSREKLANEAFMRSGLVPYDFNKCPIVGKSIQIATFSPLLIAPLKTYFASGDLPEEDPVESEPQICTIYHLRTSCLSKKFQCTVKEDKKARTYEIFSFTRVEDREEMITNNSDQTCDPLYVGPDYLSDPSIMESEKVIHFRNDFMRNAESSMNYSAENYSDQKLDQLPLICKIDEPISWSESSPTSLSPHQHIKIEADLAFDSIFVE